jgi:hypothetical protein
MDVAQTWDQLRAFDTSYRLNGYVHLGPYFDLNAWTEECRRVVAREGEETAQNIYWRAKCWPKSTYLRAALPAEMKRVAA